VSKRYVIKRPEGARVPDRLARFREELNEEQRRDRPAGRGARHRGRGVG
jgi:hypothetical protein